MEKTPASLSSFSFHTSLVECILSQIGPLPFSVSISSIITYLSPHSRTHRPCKQLNCTLNICVRLIVLLLTSVKSPSQIIYIPLSDFSLFMVSPLNKMMLLSKSSTSLLIPPFLHEYHLLSPESWHPFLSPSQQPHMVDVDNLDLQMGVLSTQRVTQKRVDEQGLIIMSRTGISELKKLRSLPELPGLVRSELVGIKPSSIRTSFETMNLSGINSESD